VFNRIEAKTTIWDLNTKDHPGKVLNRYLRAAEGIALVYDISRPETFQSIRLSWLPEIRKICIGAQFLLMGNHNDKERKVSFEVVVGRSRKPRRLQRRRSCISQR
jgi:GTPase SAR1 family protein